MRIIIAGAGEVGSHLAKMLSKENHDIVVIDPNESRLKQIESTLDVMAINGSSTSVKVLYSAGIKKTDLFIAVAHLEDTNITSAILGKMLGAAKTIARIDNNEYLENPHRDHFSELGIDYLMYPEKIAAREVLGFLHQTGSTEFFDFSGGKLSLYVIRLDKNALILNKKLHEFADVNKPLDYRGVAITRNQKTIIPNGNDTFQLNDIVYVISTQDRIQELMSLAGKEKVDIKNIMILGGSRIGKRTALELEKKFHVKLIEIDKDKCELLADILENTLIINGDGRDTDLLLEEGLTQIDAFIAVTGNSETNILSCLLAKKHGVKKTIAEIENMEYINLAENIGIDSILNKKVITAGRISRFTQTARVSMIKCLTGTDAEVLEYIVQANSGITKVVLKDLNFPKGAIVGGVIRGNNSFIAKGDTLIQAEDHVVVFALPEAFGALEKLFN